MGADGAAPGEAAPPRAARRWTSTRGTRDPYELFEDGTPRPKAAAPKKVRSLESKAFQTLALAEEAGGEAIRTRYKSLVKQLHPDANGGDRGHEDRLREVIQAYKLLKQSGFC